MTIIHTQKFRSNRNQAWHTQAAAAVTGSSPAMAIMPLLAKKSLGGGATWQRQSRLSGGHLYQEQTTMLRRRGGTA